MNTVYHILGIITFWGLVVLFAWELFARAYNFLYPRRFRFWAYQVYEYFKFCRLFKKWKADNFTTVDFYTTRINRWKAQGRYEAFEYRKRNPFKKQYLKMFDEIINSDAAKKYNKSGRFFEEVED
jgi:hypothetical protein